MADYAAQIKETYDSLTSVNVNVEENEMVEGCLGGLASKFGAFQTTVCMRENTPSFFELQLMLLVEENHVGASMSMHTNNKRLHTEEDRPHGRDG